MSERARSAQGKRFLVLGDAVRQLDGAATLARAAVYVLSRAGDLPGALDEADRALYEIAKASDMLRAQLRALQEEGDSDAP